MNIELKVFGIQYKYLIHTVATGTCILYFNLAYICTGSATLLYNICLRVTLKTLTTTELHKLLKHKIKEETNLFSENFTK